MTIRREFGFSLIELSIVLIIISLLIGSFVTTLSKRIDYTRDVETDDELQQIKHALMSYAYVNAAKGASAPYLPCPDCRNPAICIGGTARDGFEDRVGGLTGACSVNNQNGTLPWVTLGLGHNDAWGSRYSYWVDPVYAIDTGFTLASANGAGTIEEPDYATDLTDVAAAQNKDLATNVVAVVLSHGKNRYGAISEVDGGIWSTSIAAGDHPDEDENIDAGIPGADNPFAFENAVFVSKDVVEEGSGTVLGAYDDHIMWITEYELKAKMIQSEVLPQ